MRSHYLHSFKSFELVQIPVLQDNYSYILSQGSTHLVIDPGEAQPILEICKKLNIRVTHILNTHHHWDHVNGNAQIKSVFGCEVLGPSLATNPIPELTRAIQEGPLTLGTLSFQVISAPGHTQSHVILYFESEKVAFTGDVLFCGGCGRIFDGTHEQMFQSLQKIKALPPQTQIFCGHEYSLKNLEFAESLGLSGLQEVKAQWQKQRQSGLPTVPNTLEVELQINPFLRAQSVEEFRRLRTLKDKF